MIECLMARDGQWKEQNTFCFVTCLICDIWWPPRTKLDACQKPDFWHAHSTNQTVISLALSSLHTCTIKWFLCGIHYRNKAWGVVDSWIKECRFGFQNGGNILLHILHHGAVLILECLISLLYHEMLVLFLITAGKVLVCNNKWYNKSWIAWFVFSKKGLPTFLKSTHLYLSYHDKQMTVQW